MKRDRIFGIEVDRRGVELLLLLCSFDVAVEKMKNAEMEKAVFECIGSLIFDRCAILKQKAIINSFEKCAGLDKH